MPLLTHVVTGFLGAGKTTLITALLAARPAGERWAVLVNEFGQIGIDQAAWSGDDVFIREVPGGCICCAQNLPMQIALGQIAARTDCQRLIIEPTGLGHPAQILETLREPHWQPLLTVGATLCLIDARQLGDERVTGHETFRAQVEVADVLVFSKADLLAEDDRLRAQAFADGCLPPKALVVFAAPAQVDAAWLDVVPRAAGRQRRSLLRPPAGLAATSAGGGETGLGLRGLAADDAPAVAPADPPYHYHERVESHGAAHWIGGWILPPDWCFRHDDLLTLLLSWRGLDRLKGVFHTDRGWIFFNATAQDLAIRGSEYRADNRVELIAAEAPDWADCEQALLATLAPAEGDQQQA
ncbi:CobW family GTP-binding protein [Amnimonas aquatica]|uniref:CobW/HypB/UreG nucleotide-binding domain-containing protein n=1 Tax=Amnimonas aquatica TaxID=2094561 RepID=A0A2P6ATB1_9GAMM|nr:GTP-binding protein [Amnimonas aquatica]PQA45344.1 hypothetical protein C5O18_04475 [Amnimonas aquatica]